MKNSNIMTFNKQQPLFEANRVIAEKAVSKSQQRFFGMVHAYKNGELDLDSIEDEDLRDEIKSVANSISDEDAEKFASTKHDGLPTSVN